MSQRLLILIILTGLSLMGCSSEGLSGEKPPETTVVIGNETYETALGTYCWENTCVDTAGPIDLLEGKEPIKVKPDEIISLVMDYEPKPNKFYLGQISENKETEVVMKDNQLPLLHKKEYIIILMESGGWMIKKRTFLMGMPYMPLL